MRTNVKRVRMTRVAVAATIACLVAHSAGAQAANESLLDGLPDNLKSLYEGATENLQPSAYDNFKMPPPPWKWCHSESYQGNPWRVALTNELNRLVGVYKAAGKVSDFELSDSNGDTSRQIAQIRAFIDKKCSIITAVAGSSTGLNDAIEAAYKAGIPLVTISSSVTRPTLSTSIPTTRGGASTWPPRSPLWAGATTC
jgi:ribose transport system substrate-binding protein